MLPFVQNSHLSVKRRQSNFSIFVSCEEKKYYRVVSEVWTAACTADAATAHKAKDGARSQCKIDVTR